MANVMVDIETLGVRPGSVVLSIGAVVFDPKSGELGAEFYQNIDAASCDSLGLTRDPSTLEWWRNQPVAARDALKVDKVPLPEALVRLDTWWIKNNGVELWANGASFDPVLLNACYHAAGMEPVWKFWDFRCARTILALGNRRPMPAARDTAHHALHDAKAQAVAVAACLRAGIIKL